MQRDDYLKWLTDWFKKRMEMPADAIYCDFFVEGWLDSFKTIELISEIETVLNIPLNDSTLSDPRFSTIFGLADILTELKKVDRDLIP